MLNVLRHSATWSLLSRQCQGRRTVFSTSLLQEVASSTMAGRVEDLDVQMKATVDKARASYNAGKVKNLEQRLAFLRQLQLFVKEEQEAICKAAEEDVRRCHNETVLSSIVPMTIELETAIKNLSSWMKPRSAKRSLIHMLDRVEVQPQPLGVVAVIGPWNYPLSLILRPLVGVIAAGNTAVLKPSEISKGMERLISEKLPQYLDPDCFPVVTGGIPETSALLRQRFDHICFTGSPYVGRIVLRAAAEHLTPCTLELGGKNPLIIDESMDLKTAAQRVASIKSLNAGQICLNIDYIVCPRQIQAALVEEMKKAVKKQLGEDQRQCQHYCRIINERNFKRLQSMLERTKGTVVLDGGMDESELFMGMTVISDVTEDDPLMEEEVFGPLLPIVPVDGIDEAIAIVNRGEKPLSLYIFSKKQSNIDRIVNNTSSGQMVTNDAALQNFSMDAPFGGVGNSGMRSYVGKAGFDNFSHHRTCIYRSAGAEFINEAVRYGRMSERSVRVLWLAFRLYPVEYRWTIFALLVLGLSPFLAARFGWLFGA